MKIFTNKNFVQKIIICFVFVILFNFCFTSTVQADSADYGTLFVPMKKFLTTVADVTITAVQWGMTGEWIYAVDDKGAATVVSDPTNYWFKDDNNIRYPIIQISPELIFSNKIQLLDVNFINGTTDSSNYILTTSSTGLSELRTVIASWYVTLRTISIVGLLSVLIYVGIRIIISSTSQDRAKYKQRLVDWLIAFCLLFVMHYIMAATLEVVEQVDDMLIGESGDAIIARTISR